MVELTYVGFDEKRFDTGKDYVPETTDINEFRTPAVTADGPAALADVLQNTVTPKQATRISAVCMDIWQTYEPSTNTSPANAAIVLDRFPVATYPNEDSVKIRKFKHRTITQVVKDHLSGIRQNSLLDPENLTYETNSDIVPLRKSPPDTSCNRSFKAPLLLLWHAIHMVGGRPFFAACYTSSRNLLAPINKRARIDESLRSNPDMLLRTHRQRDVRGIQRPRPAQSNPHRTALESLSTNPLPISSTKGSPKKTNVKRT